MAATVAAAVAAAAAPTWAQQSNGATEALDCLIEPYVVVDLGSSAEGILADVLVGRGDFVRRGDKVATLESEVEAANVELAQLRAEIEVEIQSSLTELDLRQREHARASELHKTRVVSGKLMDEARTNLQLAELDVLEAEINRRLAELEHKRSIEVFNRRTISSPIDGVVVEKHLSTGEFVHEQAHVVTIAQLDPLRIEVFAPLARYGSIRTGMRAEVRPAQPVGGVYEAEVTVVDRVLDAASGTFGVRLEMPNPSQALPSGLRCTVEFPDR